MRQVGLPGLDQLSGKTSVNLTKLEENVWPLKSVWFPPTSPCILALNNISVRFGSAAVGQQLDAKRVDVVM